jgi:hypothetical protein
MPETVEEAVDRLMVILDDEQKDSITVMPEENLFSLHFSLGIASEMLLDGMNPGINYWPLAVLHILMMRLS